MKIQPSYRVKTAVTSTSPHAVSARAARFRGRPQELASDFVVDVSFAAVIAD